jgi:hypothetical protein
MRNRVLTSYPQIFVETSACRLGAASDSEHINSAMQFDRRYRLWREVQEVTDNRHLKQKGWKVSAVVYVRRVQRIESVVSTLAGCFSGEKEVGLYFISRIDNPGRINSRRTFSRNTRIDRPPDVREPRDTVTTTVSRYEHPTPSHPLASPRIPSPISSIAFIPQNICFGSPLSASGIRLAP